MSLNLEYDYTLNGDGSGKVALRWDGPNPGSESGIQDFLSEEIAKARGVDAWDAIACEPQGEQMLFQAVAYFPDLAALRFHNQGLHMDLMDFVARKDQDGNLVVENNKMAVREVAKAESPNEDELRARLDEERAQLAQARGFIEEDISALACSVTYRTPGRIIEAQGLKQIDNHSAQLRFDGGEVVKLLDRLMEDDALFLKLMKSPRRGPEALMDMVGIGGPLRILAQSGVEAAFPYAEEVRQARERFAEMVARLGLNHGPERSKPLANVRIIAAKVVREAEPERELAPQSESCPCVVLTVCGDLPGAALKLEGATLEALADTSGNNRLPDDDWDRRIHFPKLTKDGRTAFFDVTIKADPSSIEGFTEIRGVMTALVAGPIEEVDLGFDVLHAGAEGKEYGARIESVDSDAEERILLEIKVGIAKERVEGMALVIEGMEPIPMHQHGYSACNDECTFTYRIDPIDQSEGPPPEKARIVARVVKTIQKYLVPFAVENVDVHGRPRE